MSRSGYIDYDSDDNGSLNMWRGAVASAIRGKRGQTFLRELIAALDEMLEKKLIAAELEINGAVCALGCVGVRRGLDLSKLDPEDYKSISRKFGIAGALVREIEYLNDDEYFDHETDESRWQRMRDWTAEQLEGVVT